MAYYTPDDITNILLQTYHKTKQSQAGNELIVKFKTAELNDLLVNSLFTDNNLGMSKILSIAQGGDNYEITANVSCDKNLDLGAPGGYIYSSVPSGYDFFSGTSMATPATAGAVALYTSQNQDALLESVDLTSSLTGKTVTSGRLDIWSLLNKSAPPPDDATAPEIVLSTVELSSKGAILKILFDQELDPDSLPKSTSFTITIDGKSVKPDSFELIDGDARALAFVLPTTPLENQSIIVSYKDPSAQNDISYVLQAADSGLDVAIFADMSGNDMPTESLTSWSSYDIGSDSSSDKMVATSGDAAVGSSLIHLYFENINISASDSNSNLEAIANQGLSKYTVMQGAKKLDISDVYVADDNIDELSNSSITIVLKTALTSNASLKVTYKDTSAKDDALALQDLFGNDVSGFSYAVDVDMTSSDAATIAQALIGISVEDVIQ